MGQQKVAKKYQNAIQQAKTLWQEKHFFHWDLEFPEVFIDLNKRDWTHNPGFDVVVRLHHTSSLLTYLVMIVIIILIPILLVIIRFDFVWSFCGTGYS